jgi:DNA-binding LacI/PurR family transcriptional regulator
MTRVAMEQLLAAASGKANDCAPYVVRIPVNLIRRSSCGENPNP